MRKYQSTPGRQVASHRLIDRHSILLNILFVYLRIIFLLPKTDWSVSAYCLDVFSISSVKKIDSSGHGAAHSRLFSWLDMTVPKSVTTVSRAACTAADTSQGLNIRFRHRCYNWALRYAVLKGCG